MKWKSAGLLAMFVVLSSLAQTEEILFDRIDKNHSTIGFLVPIFGGFSEVEGKFTEFSVVMRHNPDLSKASVEVVIDAKSIVTGNTDRDQDLRGEGFFDVTRYPEIRFTSSKIRKAGDGYIADGTLVMHGVSKTIALSFRVSGPDGNEQEGWVLGVQSDLTLDRDDFGITWRHTSEAFVGNQVQIKIRLITRLTKLKPQP